MISMHSIGSSGGAAKYHDKAFTQDGVTKQADNYYVGEKATAVWQGKGADLLGLGGQAVKKEDFVDLLDGKVLNPATGQMQDLAVNSRGADRRLGYDLTVAPPKSVSIIGLVGNDERIIDAHLAANERAMSWLEKNAAIIRVSDGEGGRLAKQGDNLLYATVLHETNRNNEPHIHNHNVIVSAVYDKDSETWRSLTNDQLLILRQGADAIYKSELAHGLEKAGYKLNYAVNGLDFEIAGLSKEQIEAYSTRTVEIKQALKDRGIDVEQADFHQRQIATIDTRSVKTELPRDALQSVWQDVAINANLDVISLVHSAQSNTKDQELTTKPIDGAVHEVNASLDDDMQKQKALDSVSWAVAHLSEREQSFSSTDIELAALKFSKGRIDQVEWAIDEQLKNGSLVQREISQTGAILLTTNKGIEGEKELATNIRDGIGKGNAVLVSENEFTTSLEKFEALKSNELGFAFKLSDEQTLAAKNILMHADVYQGIQGDAGTGKTVALEFVREVAEAKGWVVMGVATSAAATKELEASSGIPSQTVAGFLVDRGNAVRLAEVELAELRGALYLNEKSAYGNIQRTESHKLTLTSDGVNHGTKIYTFDHERGEVFKSPDNLRNRFGRALLNVSENQQEKTTKHINGETLLSHLRERAVTTRNEFAQSLGQRLMTYEKAGTVEAITAKNVLHLKQNSDIENLKFKINSKQAEIVNLKTTGNKEGNKTLLVMDESSMTGIKDAVAYSRLAKDLRSRVVFQGDIKQHGSVTAGKFFEQALEAGMNKSSLQETRRFDNATEPTKQAVKLMASGRMKEAIGKLDRLEVDDSKLPTVVAERYWNNLEDLQLKGAVNPRVAVVTVTNKDRKAINQAVHTILAENGQITGASFVKAHLDDPKLTEAEQLHAGLLKAGGADHLVFRKKYSEIGVKNNDVVQVKGYDVEKNLVLIVNSKGQEIQFNPKQKDFFTPMRMETREYSVGDKIEARANIKFGGHKKDDITNGSRGVISSIDEKGATIKLTELPAGEKGVIGEVRLNNDQLQFIDLSYARTTFKEQGTTNDREIIAISKVGAKIFNRESAYVAGTRAKGNSEIVTSDYGTMLKNSEKKSSKTTATDVVKTKDTLNQQESNKEIKQGSVQDKEKALKRSRSNQNLGFTLE